MLSYLSSLNFYEKPDENETIKQEYLQFAETGFYNHWGPTIEKHENIDLYDVGLDLIEFDKTVAVKFHSYGYVNTGVQGMFKSGDTKINYLLNIKILTNKGILCFFTERKIFDEKMK